LCADCHTHQPERVFTWLANRPAESSRQMPPWFLAAASEWADCCHPKTATRHLLRLERALLTNTAARVENLLAAIADQPGGRATATLLREFFLRHGMLDESGSAAGMTAWRQQQFDRIPPRMRKAVITYIDRLARQQKRAVLYGNHGLSDKTINYQLTNLRQFAEHLATRHVTDWTAVIAIDVETYLHKDVVRQLNTLKTFFGFARQRRMVLADPTKDLSIKQRKGYTGPVLTSDQQRELLNRWQHEDTDPRERVVGLLCLLHAASNSEVRHLHVADVAEDLSAVRLGTRPHPVPLDPLTADAITACLRQRTKTKTNNPYLLIGFQTRLHQKPCSINFARQLLQRANVTPQVLRSTRLTDLTQRLDPRIVAQALDISHEAALHYVVGAIHREEVAFGATWES
jgi:site-specific recombinase XerD